MVLTHQGHILLSDSTPITGVETLTFTIYDENDTNLWSESLDITFDGGYYTVVLGESEAFPEDLFDGIDLYMGIQVGTNAEMAPYNRVTSVPYAIMAGSVTGQVDAVGGLTVDGQEVINSSLQWVGEIGEDSGLDADLLRGLTPEEIAAMGLTGTGTEGTISKFTTDGIGDSLLSEQDGTVDVSGSMNVDGTIQATGGVRLGYIEECTSEQAGMLRWNETVEVCDGSNWSPLNSSVISGSSCLDIKTRDSGAQDGTYLIDVDGSGEELPVEVYCDMSTEGGGWTLIFSSQTVGGRGNQTGSYNDFLASITPSGSMLSTWTPFASVSAIRFACDANKDGSIDYDGKDSGNDIYAQIKNCTTGLCQTQITMDDGRSYGNNNESASHPDWWITTNSKWGSYDDYPYNSTSNDDLCNGTSYQTRGLAYPTTDTTSNAYFYVFVRE